MQEKMKLTITHLYPDMMNLYGDIGNIIALKERGQARGIEVKIQNIKIGDGITSGETDIYFFGGGQDLQQMQIAQDLIKYKKKPLLADLNNNVVMLAICGGYQLLGEYYLDGSGGKAEGLKFFPIETVAPSTEVKKRCIGNIVTNITNQQTMEDIKSFYNQINSTETPKTLVGFENHSGRTKLLNDKNIYTGEVVLGIGDSEKGGYEGLRFKNAFGSYMHGSFLPKNPHFADMLLSLALARKYSQFEKMPPLDDSLEWIAHSKAIEIASKK